MRKILFVMAAMAGASLSAGCSMALFSSTNTPSDDLYAIHDRTEIYNRQTAKAEADKAAAEARRAEWEARIAEAEAADAEQRYYEYKSEGSYRDVVADTYESAYARRLRGFQSPTYRLPSSYYNYRYGSAFTYVSAYDPAFYNVIVMGDEVWVEPKYITAMFGTWGTVVASSPWYYGWNYAWGPTLSIGSWGWSFGWNTWYTTWLRPWDPWSPWYNSWYGYGWGGWGPGWHGGYGPGWHGVPPIYWGGGGGHHQPVYDPNRSNYVHRPGNRFNGGFSDNRTPTFGGSRPTINGSTSGNRNWNSGVVQGSGNNRPGGNVNRGNSGTQSQNRYNQGTPSWNDRSNSRRSSSSGSYDNSGSYNTPSRSGGYGGSTPSGGGSRSGSVTGSGSRGR